MVESTKKRVSRVLRAREDSDAFARFFVCIAVLTMVAVALGLRQRGFAATHTEQVLDCHYAGDGAHTHDTTCYDADGNLVCPLQEREYHVHDDSCYAEARVLTCGLEESAEHTHSASCYTVERELTCGMEEVAEQHTHGPGCFKTITVADDADAAAGSELAYEDANQAATDTAASETAESEISSPAQTFAHNFEDADGKLVLGVDVDAPEGALPAGTTMRAAWIDAVSLTSKEQKAIEKAVGKKTDGKIMSQMAVDIAFVDAYGKEVEPAKKVTVTFTSDKIDTTDKPVVAHVNDLTEAEIKAQQKALEEGKTAEEAEPTRKAQVVEQLDEAALAQRKMELSADQLAFDATKFSMFVLNVTSEAHTLVSEGEGVRVVVEAPAAAGVPAEATLAVTEVAGDAYAVQLNEALSAESIAQTRYFEVHIMNGAQEVLPAKPVKISFELADAPEGAAGVAVTHLGDQAKVVASSEDLSAASFEAAETGVYVVAYTVEAVDVAAEESETTVESITASSKTYRVTVTFGADAQIPVGSILKVTELDAESEAWQEAYDQVVEFKREGDEGFSGEGMGFDAIDITIFAEDGSVVEPAAPVQVSITRRELPEGVDEGTLAETLEVQHIVEAEADENQQVQLVANADEAEAGSVTVEDGQAVAEFEVDGFSTYTITWGNATSTATNTMTNLRLRENYNTRAEIPVYYVDQDGNAITRPTGINGNTDQTVSWRNNQYVYNIRTDNIARSISGYSYQGAHSGSYNSTEISSVTLQRSWSGNRYYYSTNVNSIYLVYSDSTSSDITVHYGYMDGNTFVEFTEDEDGDVPAGTTVPKPSQYGDQWDLEKTIPGYRYVTSRINDPKDGREISSLLNTDPPYKAGVNNTFENADLSDYPSYTSSTAPTSFVSEWRYRQLSKSDWNPTGQGWAYSATEPVTDSGVTKPVSFAESEKDIYVIYEKGSMSGGSGDGETPDLGELNAPATDKQVASNQDGTYDVTLSATSEKKNAESSTKANVVIVLDTSWSMYEKDAGGGMSRLSVAKTAIGSLADKLFALNEEESDTIELAFVNFAQRVRNEEEMRTIYSGTNATSFKNMINALDCASGTNWDDALYAANHIYFNDNDPTYVVFVTDGDPISCAHPYGTYSDWDGGTYYNVRSNYEYALAAKNQADLIIANNKTLYTVGAFGEISNLQAIGGTYLGQANNTTAINGYFDDIIADIQSALGYRDITINDGITALSSTGLARGDISSLRYYRSGGENANGSEKYDHTANNGHGVEWEDAPAAYLLEVKSENGTTKYYKNGTAASLGSLTDLTEAEFLEKYPVGSRTVVWDINSGSDELLEDGVTYTMIFTMWPSQEAYDLIADLNNEAITYESLSQAEKDQVFLGDDNVYYLKTNTKATVDYTSVKLVNGEVSGTPTSASAPIEDPKGKMNLDTSVMTVRKEFAHLINEADPYEEIVFYLLVDGKYYNKDGTLSDTLDESKAYAMSLPKDGKWEDEIYIAPGLMRGGEILETGHNYSLEEKIVSGNPYEYEFAPQTVRPMVITAVPTFLVKKDTFNTNSESKQEYTFNDADSSYVEVEGKSDAAGTYYVASENNGSLVGVNHKTSELDITKIINDPQNLLTDAQEASETFTYRVTLQIPDGSDPSGIVGYEYVPRTQSNAYTLFGYQTGQSAFAEDIARFNGKTYRAWNTLVYDALIEYDRVTENGNTFIRAKRDTDGNIIWKVYAVGGYHTITYDMTLKQDEVIRFTNLPTGTKYVIQEIYANKYPADNAGGKTDGRTPVADASNLAAEGYEIEGVKHTGGTLSADKTTVEGTIEAPDTRYYNQYTNTRVTENTTTRVELKVKKVVEDYTWGEEYYRFTLTAGTAEYSDTEGGTGTSPMPDGVQNSVVSIYDSTPNHTLSFAAIRYTRPGTYTYTVSENDNSANMPNVQFASPTILTVTVTEDSNGKLAVTNIEDDQDVTEYFPEEGSAIATGLSTMTNTTKKLQIRKVDKANSETVLSGAQFEIRSGEAKLYLQGEKLLTAEDVEAIIEMSLSDDGAGTAMEDRGISSSFTLGEIQVGGFVYDTVYELKEISAPAGYIINNGSTYFKAINEGGRPYLRLTDQNGIILTDDDEQPILDNDYATVAESGLSISIKNEPGAELPNAGGVGTELFLAIGAGMMAAGALVLFQRRGERHA